MSTPFRIHTNTPTTWNILVGPVTRRINTFVLPPFWAPLFTDTLQPLYPNLYIDNYYHEYTKIILTFIIAGALCFLLFILAFFFSFTNQKEYEKTSEYECGFEPFDSATRQPYDVHFYMVGILFMVFDVEIALLFPWAANLSAVNSTGFWSVILFLIILTVGFVYEWQRGALAWPHPTIDLDTTHNKVE